MGRTPVLAVAIAWSLGACGPIAYVNEVTRRASEAVESARAAEADKYAPYYWTRAIQYLHHAREEAARADFEGANRFGRLAAEAGELATTEAVLAAKDPSRRPLEEKLAPARAKHAPGTPKHGLAPAKDAP